MLRSVEEHRECEGVSEDLGTLGYGEEDGGMYIKEPWGIKSK